MTDLIYQHPAVRDNAPCIVGTKITVREIQETRAQSAYSRSKLLADFGISDVELNAALNYELRDITARSHDATVRIEEGSDHLIIDGGGQRGAVTLPIDDAETLIAAIRGVLCEWLARREVSP